MQELSNKCRRQIYIESFQEQLQQCTEQCQCDYNVSIRVLQQYVKTQHLGNFTTSDLYYSRFSQLGNPTVYHTPRRLQLQFYDVIFSLVIIRLLGHCISHIYNKLLLLTYLIHIKNPSEHNQLFLHCWRFGLYQRPKRQQCKNNYSWLCFDEFLIWNVYQPNDLFIGTYLLVCDCRML